MERPALRRLLADIDMGRIDTMVVYKVDRLTRSLGDFSKIVEVFDTRGVSFVSVTQQFNTTTSMGRLTLNMLLSFAQFELGWLVDQVPDFKWIHICYDDPHPPYFVPRPYDSLIDPESLPLPEQGDGALLPEWHNRMREECGTYQASGADIRNVLATYYGMIRYVDDEMVRVHAALDSRGLLETTWIIIGSDHGDYTGEKGFFNKSESLYKCLLHVPLIILPPVGSALRHAKRAALPSPKVPAASG